MRFPRMSGNAWVCTIITCILLLSGAEQAVRAIRGRAERREPPPEAQALKVGDAAPAFKLPDDHGKAYSLAQFRGKPVVVNFFCGCSRCQAIAEREAKWLRKNPNVNMIALVTFQPQYFKEWRQKTGLKYPFVMDPAKEVAMQYNSMVCPRVWVLDKNGRAVFTNPEMPEMLSPDDTVAMAMQSYGKPAPASAPKTKVARS